MRIKMTSCCALSVAWMWAFAGLSAANDTRLADALEKRDIKTATALLAQRVDVNLAQPDGGTPLHWAAHWNELSIAKQLLASGANANALNDLGVSPLALAASDGSVPMIEALLGAGARANAALPTGVTVLMAAARTGRVDALNLLLAHGADVNQKQRSRGQTALMWAVAEGHVDAVRVLIEHGADVQAQTTGGFTPLMFAAREGNADLARLLLAHGANVNDAAIDGSTPLLVATVRAHVELATLFLEQGADPNGNPEAAGYTPLHWASGKSETFTTFNYQTAPGEWTALAGIPVRAGKLALIKALLSHGADANAKTSKQPPRFGVSDGSGHSPVGASPLLLAAFSGDADVMRLLAANGADPLASANDGSTVLMAAAGMIAQRDETTTVPEGDFLNAVKLALELGVPIEATNRRGYRAMHQAAAAGFTTVLRFLVEKGAELNAKTGPTGGTPLAVADGTAGSLYHERPAAAAVLRELGAVK